MQRRNSGKALWKESFQKARSFSQSSMSISRKTSLLEAETSDTELQEYLASLKKKSGIKGLWSGEKFKKAVRDDEDKTPDISISSVDDEQDQSFHSEKSQDDTSDDDFKPNLMMLSKSLSEELESDSSSIQLMHGIKLALSDDESQEKPTEQDHLNNKSEPKSISEPKELDSIMNNLHMASEIDTEDEVVEEIKEDVINEVIPPSDDENKSEVSEHREDVSSIRSSPEPIHSIRDKYGRRLRNRSSTRTPSAQSYTMDFSSAEEISAVSEKTESKSYSKSSRSRRSSRSSCHSSRSSHHSSRSRHKSKSYKDNSVNKSHSESSKHNKKTCDIGIQTIPESSTSYGTGLVPPGLGVGMATSGPRLGMQYVDPSPIATHVVSADTLEAMTAYNPAVVALTDILRQQMRLVEQFVDANNRMYQAYTSNMNTHYNYTTLEDTMEFIRRNRPKTLTLKDALKQVKKEDSS